MEDLIGPVVQDYASIDLSLAGGPPEAEPAHGSEIRQRRAQPDEGEARRAEVIATQLARAVGNTIMGTKVHDVMAL
ncbi:MAG: hypothetical protein R2706_09425 [Acidimicrobiales bacterium]